MAHKQLLLSFFVNILGEFVNGLTEENLKVGVWGGNIKLTKLTINKEGLEKMNLPLCFRDGQVDTLEIKIPWTNLDKNPVQIIVTGVHLLVGPVDFSTLTADSAAARCKARKKEQVDKAERVIEMSAVNMIGPDTNRVKSSSFVRRIWKKIVKNLEVYIHNVHIRYEDATTLANSKFNVGFVTRSFSFKALSEESTRSYLQNQDSMSPSTKIRCKAVCFCNVGVYWNFDGSCHNMSVFEDYSRRQDLNFIIHPDNELTAILMLNYAADAVPQTTLSINDARVIATIDQYQLHQAIVVQRHTVNAIAKLNIIQHRPRQSATEKPIYWWKYIVMLLTNNPDIFNKKIDKAMLCCKYRKRYIELVMKGKLVDKNTRELMDLTSQEEAEVEIIDELLPVDALIVFRQVAAKEAFVQNRHCMMTLSTHRKSKRFSIFRRFEIASKKIGGDEPESVKNTAGSGQQYEIEQLEESLKDMILSTDTIDNSLFTLDLFSVFKISLSISANTLPLAQVEAKFHIDSRIRPTTAFTSLSLDEISVTDLITTKPSYPNLLEFSVNKSFSRGNDDGIAPIMFLYDKQDNASSKIALSIQPLLMCLNSQAFLGLMNLCQIRHLNITWGNVIDDLKRLLNVYDISNSDKTVHLDVNVLSPRIIIPAGTSACHGYINVSIVGIKFQSKETTNNYFETKNDIASGTFAAEGLCVEYVPSEYQIFGGADTAKKQMLLKPIDFSMSFRMLPDTGENFSIDISVHQYVEVNLQLIHITLIKNVIVSLASGKRFVKGKVRGLPGKKLTRMLTSVTQKSCQLVSKALLKIHSKIRVKPSSCLLKCNALIPGVSISILYDDLDQKSFVMNMETIMSSIEMNHSDFVTTFTLDGLTAEDNHRQGTKVCVLCSKRKTASDEKTHEKFLRVSYTQHVGYDSPTRPDYGTYVTVSLLELTLELDANFFLRLYVILDALEQKVDNVICPSQAIGGAENCTTSYDNLEHAIDEVGHVDREMKTPPGINLTFVVGKLALVLDKETNPTSMENHTAQAKVMESVVKFETCEISGDAAITRNGGTLVNLHCGSIRISDMRDITSEFCFNDILRPYGDDKSPNDRFYEAIDDVDVSSLPAFDGTGAVKKAHHLSISFVEDKLQCRNFEILARSCTIFLSLDIILEAQAVVTDHFNSIKKIKRTLRPSVAVTASFDSDSEGGNGFLKANSNVGESQKTKSCSVRLLIPNPHFIFLENPTVSNTEAIVCRSRIDIQFRQDVTDFRDPEIMNSIHLSLLDMEMFTLLNMEYWRPRQLIYPVSCELHATSASTRSVMTQATTSLNVGQVIAKFSLNDLILLRSIWLRRGLVSDITSSKDGVALTPFNISFGGKDGESSQMVFYDVNINFEAISVMVINDFEQSNIPLLNFSVEKTSCKVEGFLQDLRGTGAMVCCVNYYNSTIQQWEPLLECWNIDLSLTSSSVETTLKLTSANHVQFNITSDFLQIALQTLSLLHTFRDGTERDLLPALMFENSFGLSITILDSRTKQMLFLLNHSNCGRVFIGQQSRGCDVMSDQKKSQHIVLPKLPDHVDIYFEGSCSAKELSDGNYCPLIQLPLLSTNITTVYPMSQLNNSQQKHTDSKHTVQEDIYEYQRYNPLLLSWVDPFLSGDPCRWSDASGTLQRNGKNSMTLPDEFGWNWIEDWRVDVDAKIGIEIDDDGYHYGFDFYSICGENENTRSFRPMDCVRRRRWVRRRMKETQFSPQRSMFCDISVTTAGVKVVTIRSALQFENKLPYDVSVHLDNGYIIGPIPENKILSVPYIQSRYAKSFEVKPTFLPYDLTSEITCCGRSSNFFSIYNVRCTLRSDPKSYLSINALVRQKEQSMLISLFPFTSVFNALPCVVRFKFTNPAGDVIEQDCLNSAENQKLCVLSLKETTFVSLRLESTDDWSPLQALHFKKNCQISIPVFTTGSSPLHLYLSVHFVNTDISKIEIYAKCAFVDYTRLNIALASTTDLTIENNSVRNCYTDAEIDDMCFFDSLGEMNECSSPLDVGISGFVVRSRRFYSIISHVTKGSFVYTDRDLRFYFLPKVLMNQTYISTPCDDRFVLVGDGDTQDFLSFNISSKAMIFIIIDKRSSTPQWMKKSKYKKISGYAVAVGLRKGFKQEIHYSVFGKSFEPGKIQLGSNTSKDANEMYGIFVVGTNECDSYHRYLLRHLAHQHDEICESSNLSWSNGGHGMRLFDFDKEDKVRIGVAGRLPGEKSNYSWSQTTIDIVKTISDIKIPFEVISESTNTTYQLAYRIQALPGVFHNMKILEVIPRFLVANATDELLYLRQEVSDGETTKADDIFDICPFDMRGWHKTNSSGKTLVQIRVPSTPWCCGAFDMNEIGSTQILLPKSSTDQNKINPTVINVEVKLGGDEDKCYICVLLWKSIDVANSPVSVSNNSSYMVSISQLAAVTDCNPNKSFEYRISPNTSIPFGWSLPNIDAPRTIFVSVGDSIDSEIGKTIQVDVLELSEKADLCLMHAENNAIATVSIELQSMGRIINVSDCDTSTEKKADATKGGRRYSLHLAMTTIGLSLVAAIPFKRELVSCHIDDFLLKQGHIESASSVELTIGNVHVDNYSETAVYPVLFRMHEESYSIRKDAVPNRPFIHAVLLKEFVDGTFKIAYFSMVVLKFVVEIDSGSIHILLSDLFAGIDFVSSDKLKAFSHPKEWMQDYNFNLLSSYRYELADIEKLLLNAQQSRIFFENIIIHPTQCFLTFVHTERAKREDASTFSSASYVDIIASIGAVDLMAIRLKSFIVSNVIESMESLQSRIWEKVKRDIKMQLAQIAGSLTILGSPVGLVRNVGSGVKSFFYEPAAGLVESPLSFVRGIHKGTSGLVSGVISGALNSTAALVGTASSGISFLSGDHEYMQNRSLRMKKQQAARRGAISGLVEGSVAAITGISTGVSGVVMKPVEGAMKEGPVGLLKGIGKGIAGVAIKPVLGVADGVTSIVQGISNEVGQSYGHIHVRPARAFHRLQCNPHARVLSPVDINDAYAQEFVFQHSKRICTEDEFISQITISGESQIIFSEKFFWWKTASKLVVILWDDISYVLHKSCQLEIHHAAAVGGPLEIYAGNEISKLIYKEFLCFAHKMTNPSVMTDALSRGKLHQAPWSLSKEIKNLNKFSYKFGCHNYDHFNLEKMNDTELILRTRAKLLMALEVCGDEDELMTFGAIDKFGSGTITTDFPTRRGDYIDQLYEYIDVTASHFVHQWDHIHSGDSGRNLSHCCLTVLINSSQNDITVINTEIITGHMLWSLGSQESYCALNSNGDGESPDVKRIPPGGYVFFVICGNTPSFFHSGNIELMLQTSAFDVVLTSNEKRTSFLLKKEPFSAEFVEKSNVHSWSKYVLYVSDSKGVTNFSQI